VRTEDVEAAASIHQHLGEPQVADDPVDNQRVMSWVGDAVRVILTAEGDGVPRPFEEGEGGGSLLRSEDLMPLPLALAVDMSTVGPPKMRFSTAGKPLSSLSPPSFLASPSFAAT
jgi:hypothetical protein